ncbi:MAG: lysyl oxidase family protein [Nitrosarchaeum sp.]
MNKNKNVMILSVTVILITVGAITLTSIKDAQAYDDVWSWKVDSSCGNAKNGFHCNIPVGAVGIAKIPDLREAVPQQIGLQNTQQHTTLRISTSIANIGDGQWQMRSETPATPTLPQLAKQQLLKSDGTLWNEYTVSEFQYHPEHKHFHIAAVTSYELYTASGPYDTHPTTKTGTGAQKVTFCLIDWIKISDNSPNNERAYSLCDGQFQGVSPGWMDQYHHELEGQELDMTNVSSGYYFLVVTANPEHHFIETDFTNNQSWVLIHYNNDNKGNPKFEILNQSACPDYPGLCAFSPNR